MPWLLISFTYKHSAANVSVLRCQNHNARLRDSGPLAQLIGIDTLLMQGAQWPPTRHRPPTLLTQVQLT